MSGRAPRAGPRQPVLILEGEEEDPQGFSEPQLPTWAGGAAAPKPPVPKGRGTALRGHMACLSLPHKPEPASSLLPAGQGLALSSGGLLGTAVGCGGTGVGGWAGGHSSNEERPMLGAWEGDSHGQGCSEHHPLRPCEIPGHWPPMGTNGSEPTAGNPMANLYFFCCSSICIPVPSLLSRQTALTDQTGQQSTPRPRSPECRGHVPSTHQPPQKGLSPKQTACGHHPLVSSDGALTAMEPSMGKGKPGAGARPVAE